MAAWWVHKVKHTNLNIIKSKEMIELFLEYIRNSRPVSAVDLRIEKPEGKWPKGVLTALKMTSEALATFQSVTFSDRLHILK